MALKKKKKPSTLLKEAFALFGPKGQYWGKGAERIKPGTEDDSGKTFPEGAYCSIGAIRKVNTVNQNRAIAYLAFAIRVTENDSEIDDNDVITSNNDEDETSFSDIKKWFNKAIAMAKAAGD